MGMAKEDRVNIDELIEKHWTDVVPPPEAMNQTDPPIPDLDNLLCRQTAANGRIIRVAGNGFQRIPLQKIQNTACRVISKVDSEVGITAIMGADGFELVIRTVQVCVGHDNDLHEVRF